ncbi:HEAT repeat domain-containing protein [Armatimonas sp.]|uniref:HEAT repeat domain-containing protein n=1 Tax=Armatimonas sp. TaxID=1872638 RepID=UPI00286BC251|nr:HEAT repeat domain-containing protein [Armatimonas sp.]
MALSLEGVDNSVVRERIQHLKHHPDWDERICRFIASQPPERAVAFVREAILKPESPYEKWLFRDARLASRCLKDFAPTPEISLLRDELGLRFLPIVLDMGNGRNLHYCDGLRELVWEVLLELKSEAVGTALALQCETASKDSAVYLNAARALIKLGDERGVAALIALCQEKGEGNNVYRYDAVEILGDLGVVSQEVIATLIERCLDRDDNNNVRSLAMKALGKLGVTSAEVVDALIELCASEVGYEKIDPMRALAKLGDEQSIAALVALSEGEQPLASLWHGTTRSRYTFIEMDEVTEEARIRRVAAELLGKLGEVHGIAELVALCQDREVRVNIRIAAAEVLAQRGDKRGIEVLVSLCHHPDMDFRLVAAKALAKLGNARGIETLAALSSGTCQYK